MSLEKSGRDIGSPTPEISGGIDTSAEIQKKETSDLDANTAIDSANPSEHGRTTEHGASDISPDAQRGKPERPEANNNGLDKLKSMDFWKNAASSAWQGKDLMISAAERNPVGFLNSVGNLNNNFNKIRETTPEEENSIFNKWADGQEFVNQKEKERGAKMSPLERAATAGVHACKGPEKAEEVMTPGKRMLLNAVDLAMPTSVLDLPNKITAVNAFVHNAKDAVRDNR